MRCHPAPGCSRRWQRQGASPSTPPRTGSSWSGTRLPERGSASSSSSSPRRRERQPPSAFAWGTSWSWNSPPMVGASLGLVVLLALHADEAPVEVEQPLVRRNPVRFEIGAFVELRSGQPQGGPGTHLTDLEVDPVAAIRLPLRTGSLTLAYEPRIFIAVHEY